ncbi:hypothetical protein EVAR_23855_1 [Eumeta japonica]|uniref:Uncharacterized protein n=1 Tax=Eumeta variegata TaxID=151549 RepID=A0A4C1V5A5_EUMVA|nr:hypothetical protein EVAR_23855_1 [Eumeta japonica]
MFIHYRARCGLTYPAPSFDFSLALPAALEIVRSGGSYIVVFSNLCLSFALNGTVTGYGIENASGTESGIQSRDHDQYQNQVWD